MSGEHVTRSELDSQLILVHETIKMMSERHDIKHNALLERLDTVAEQNRAVLKIQTGELKLLNEHRIKTETYWKITGFALASNIGAVVKLLFFP